MNAQKERTLAQSVCKRRSTGTSSSLICCHPPVSPKGATNKSTEKNADVALWKRRDAPFKIADQRVLATACCWTAPELAGLVERGGGHGCVVAAEGDGTYSGIRMTAVMLQEHEMDTIFDSIRGRGEGVRVHETSALKWAVDRTVQAW